MGRSKLQLYHSMDLFLFSSFFSLKSILCLLLASLVSQMFSLKPYREGEFGVSSLRLLYALHPITSLHPVINSNVGQLWMTEIPQMLQMLDGEGLAARWEKWSWGRGADSRRDQVPRYRMDLPWGEENQDQSLCLSEMPFG